MKDIHEIDLGVSGIYQHKVWGDTQEIARLIGRDPAQFGEETIGEVFVASTHPDGPSRFVDGRLFDEVIATEPQVFGNAITPKKAFPLLLKVLCAREELSIQTHYKNKIEGWITLSDGEIFYGLTPKGEEAVSTPAKQEDFYELLQNETKKEVLAEYFNLIAFKPGQVFMVQAGMVHALLSGSVFEPQKNCNLTMRGADWGRNLPNRPLHKEDFFQSLYPFATSPEPIGMMYKMKDENAHHACLFATEDFALDEIVVSEGGARTIKTYDDRFFIAMVMDGEITLKSETEENTFHKGQAFVMSAVKQPWTFSGNGRVLLTYVPHLLKGIIEPLFEHGYSYEEIATIGGPIVRQNDVYIEMKERGLL